MIGFDKHQIQKYLSEFLENATPATCGILTGKMEPCSWEVDPPFLRQVCLKNVLFKIKKGQFVKLGEIIPPRLPIQKIIEYLRYSSKVLKSKYIDGSRSLPREGVIIDHDKIVIFPLGRFY